MDGSVSVVLDLLGLAMMLAVPAYCVLQLFAAIRLRGGARTAALLPLIPAMPLIVWCAYALADQSNLWPVPFILFAPFGTIYLAIVLLANRTDAH